MENSSAVKATGDPDHPITRGRICNRGKLMLDHVYHKDRLDFPLKRKGERGAGQWERIPWDQAMDEVVKKIASLRDKHGAETLAMGNGGSGVGLVPAPRVKNKRFHSFLTDAGTLFILI